MNDKEYFDPYFDSHDSGDNILSDMMDDKEEVLSVLDELFQDQAGYDLILCAIATRIIHGKSDDEAELFYELHDAVKDLLKNKIDIIVSGDNNE